MTLASPDRRVLQVVLVAVTAVAATVGGRAAQAPRAAAPTRAAAIAPTPAPMTDAAIDARADALLARMTTEEKVDFIGGVDFFYVRDIPRLGIPRLKMADGPMGVRNWGPATSMPAGIGLAASFDPALAERIGREMGRDARSKGVNFLLGPGVNIYLAPMNGRNFEYFGEDPFLAARTAVGYIRGIQSQGVSATVKHFAGNNSEYDRHGVDDGIDERTLREIFLPAFEAAVTEAHVGALMDSYNLVNGLHPTESAHLNIDIVKHDWGFRGVVMSDWFATYDGVKSANAGMDLEMPSGDFMNRASLLPALQAGTVTMATLDDKVRRILRTAVRFGWLDRGQQDATIPRFNQDGRRVALDGAREAIVLLKNANSLLPLNRAAMKSIAVIGPNAFPAVPVAGGSGRVFPFHAVSLLEGLTTALSTGARPVPVLWDRGLPPISDLSAATNFTTTATGHDAGLRAEYYGNDALGGTPVGSEIVPHIGYGRTTPGGDNGGLTVMLPALPTNAQSERFTGYFTPPAAGAYDVIMQSTGEDGGAFRLSIDDKVIFDQWDRNLALVPWTSMPFTAGAHKIVLEHKGRSAWLGGSLHLAIVQERSLVRQSAIDIASKADAVVVAVGFDPDSESEASDRTFRLPPGQDEFIRQIVAANPKTTVVLTSGGGVDMTRWIDTTPALLQAWYPGQEGGTALADILLGTTNPSGRLPASFERQWEDNPVHDSYYEPAGSHRVAYTAGVFVGYRGYEKNNVKPLFPFGFGLSYTTFAYRNLTVTAAPGSTSAAPKYTVAFDVANTGTRAGADVAQVYVGPQQPKVPRPAKELKGFARVTVAPGAMQHVTVTLDARAFAYYDVAGKKWQVDPGEYTVLVGRSSADIVLRGAVQLR
jgi:beta-glucosidase